MRQMAAVRKVHAENSVSGIQKRKVNRGVGLRAGVRLHIGMLGAKQLFSALDGNIFNNVNAFAAAVIAFSRVALGVFVG